MRERSSSELLMDTARNRPPSLIMPPQLWLSMNTTRQEMLLIVTVKALPMSELEFTSEHQL